jgi:hypothetical protein
MSPFSDNRRFRKLSRGTAPRPGGASAAAGPRPVNIVMAGLVPATHAFGGAGLQRVGALDKGGMRGGGAVSILTHPWVYSDGLIGSRGLG